MERERRGEMQEMGNWPLTPDAQVNQEVENPNKWLESLYAKSREEAKLLEPGTLQSLSGNLQYRGSISLHDRLKNGEITGDQLKRAKEIMAECYGEVGPGAAMRCGDGRSEVGLEVLPLYELAIRQLGPQAMGASQTYATTYRAVMGIDSSATLEGDLFAVRPAIQAIDSDIGMHTDTGKHTHGKTGCGAYNNHQNGIELYDSVDDSGASILAGNIVGPSYSQAAHEQQAEVLRSLPEDYAGDGSQLLEGLKSLGNSSAQTYGGGHLEAFVVVNNVHGTTFNRELFNARCKEELGVEIQAFNVDAWAFPAVAEKLFPDDTAKQEAYITACADWQARPAAFLTDGSQEVIVRNSKNLALAA